MVNEIRKVPFLVPPPAKAGSGGGTATESPKQPVSAKSPAPIDTPEKRELSDAEPTVAPPRANARLSIEKDEVNGGFIYKSIDRETGEVLQQYPREHILRRIAKEKAAEGVILDTKA